MSLYLAYIKPTQDHIRCKFYVNPEHLPFRLSNPGAWVPIGFMGVTANSSNRDGCSICSHCYVISVYCCSTSPYAAYFEELQQEFFVNYDVFHVTFFLSRGRSKLKKMTLKQMKTYLSKPHLNPSSRLTQMSVMASTPHLNHIQTVSTVSTLHLRSHQQERSHLMWRIIRKFPSPLSPLPPTPHAQQNSINVV